MERRRFELVLETVEADDQRNNEEQSLSDLAAAYYLGITRELLFKYTQYGCGEDKRRLQTIEVEGRTHFDKAELKAFDEHLQQPWGSNARRAPPKFIEDHLRVESRGGCMRCNVGAGLETAHIVAWATCNSHYHRNLIRLCAQCHKEHDLHGSLISSELRVLKNQAVERTRSNLVGQMRLKARSFDVPMSETKFVGREKDVASLQAALEKYRTVLIQGAAGIGKTQLLLKAFEGMKTSRRVIWLSVERYRSADDVVTALKMLSNETELLFSSVGVSGWLDNEDTCVAIDGIERLAESSPDDVDDLLVKLQKISLKAQFVVTSQVSIQRTHFDHKIDLTGLEPDWSVALLRSLVGEHAGRDKESRTHLLEFADGHPLTIRLIAMLVEHFRSESGALREIRRRGAQAVEIPKRAEQNRETSLKTCLSLAYEMLTTEERRVLFMIASCPAGMFSHHVELHVGEEGAALIAALSRWSLAHVKEAGESNERWFALSPIRSFVINKWSTSHETESRTLRQKLLCELGELATVLAQKLEEGSDIPHWVARFREEWANFLLVVEEAESLPKHSDLRELALAVCSSMMHFFFLTYMPEQGVRMMGRGAKIAVQDGKTKDAVANIVHAVSLSQRSGDPHIIAYVDDLLQEIAEGSSENNGDIAVARAMLANKRGDALATEQYARQALRDFEASRKSLKSELERTKIEAALEHNDNDLSGAHQMLGHAFLALGRANEALTEYELALDLVRGGSKTMNEGQIVHQIGLCKSRLGEHREAVNHLVQAAVWFHEIGMCEYLANALGNLGFDLLVLDVEQPLPVELTKQVLLDGVDDAIACLVQCLCADHVPNLEDSAWSIRRLFGVVVVISVSSDARLLGESGRA